MHFTWFDVWVVYMGISLFKRKKKITKVVCRNMQFACSQKVRVHFGWRCLVSSVALVSGARAQGSMFK